MSTQRIYQINTVPFLKKIGVQELDLIPNSVLNALKYKWNIDYVYLLSVWERTEVPYDRNNPDNKFLFGIDHACGDKPWRLEDVITSGFSIKNYQVAADIGGIESLKILKKRLNQRGMKLILDFVPNHTAQDHPWVIEQQHFYIHNQNGTIAYGQENHSEPWKDTYQLDYSNPVMRFEMLKVVKEIAKISDGLRCDMAHCVLNNIFDKTWQNSKKFGSTAQLENFWTQVRETVGSEFILIAECYHQTEIELINQGFDAVYDKDNGFYDKLLRTITKDLDNELHSHLVGCNNFPVSSHNKTQNLSQYMVRFIENHDEERAAQVFREKLKEAIKILINQYNNPQGYIFLHDGQLVGNTIKTPVQLGKFPYEKPNLEVLNMYEEILQVNKNWQNKIPEQFKDNEQKTDLLNTWPEVR
jgi:hypothetical protein